MFKIGEFSQMVQVSTRMLRHYDKLGLLQPSEVDNFTGYRYYTLAQIPQLNRILALKDLGFSLSEVGELLRENISLAEMRGMLRLKQAEIARTVIEEEQRLLRVAARLKQIEQAGQPSPYEVVIKQPTPLTVASQRQVVPHMDDMPAYRCTMLADTYAWLAKRRVPPAGPELLIYHGYEFTDMDIDMEAAVPIPPDALEELAPYPHPEVRLRRLGEDVPLASTIHQGSIYELPQAITALFSWVKENGYAAGGVIREIHLSGPETSKTDFGAIVFELQIALRDGEG